eukprot:4928702-Prymnesium_polylepis.1
MWSWRVDLDNKLCGAAAQRGGGGSAIDEIDPVSERQPEHMEAQGGGPDGAGTPAASGRRDGTDWVRTHLRTPDGSTT